MLELLKTIHSWGLLDFYWTENRLYISEQNTSNETTFECDIIIAYTIFKALGNAMNFDWCANNDELISLAKYISENAHKDCNYDISLVDEINKRMKIVGCPNFLSTQDKRIIISDAIDFIPYTGLVFAFNDTIKKRMKERKEEIPPILSEIDMRCGAKSLRQFMRTLRKITEDYIIQNDKIYKYIGDI